MNSLHPSKCTSNCAETVQQSRVWEFKAYEGDSMVKIYTIEVMKVCRGHIPHNQQHRAAPSCQAQGHRSSSTSISSSLVTTTAGSSAVPFAPFDGLILETSGPELAATKPTGALACLSKAAIASP